jgi:hypothetical protein
METLRENLSTAHKRIEHLTEVIIIIESTSHKCIEHLTEVITV